MLDLVDVVLERHLLLCLWLRVNNRIITRWILVIPCRLEWR